MLNVAGKCFKLGCVILCLMYQTNLKIMYINIRKIVHNYIPTYDVVLYRLEIISVWMLLQEPRSAFSCARLEGVKVDAPLVFVLYEHPSRPYTKTNSIFYAFQVYLIMPPTKAPKGRSKIYLLLISYYMFRLSHPSSDMKPFLSAEGNVHLVT
jgi:hypothetical protein